MVSERATNVLGSSLPANMAYDNAFVVNNNRAGTAILAQLEASLKHAKSTEDNTNIQKYLELIGDHHSSFGNYVEAIASYEEANAHFRLNDKLFIQVANKLIQASIDADQFSNVSRSCNELRKLYERKSSRGAFNNYTRAHYLVAGSFLQMRDASQLASAARRFLEVPFDGLRSPAVLLSATDLVTYVSLIGLAFFSREEIKNSLLGAGFKKFLELKPIWRKIITDYQSCDFGSVLKKLNAMKLDMRMDKYIGRHVPKLFSIIKRNAVVTYFKPFSALRIPHLAEVFDCKVDEMEQTLVNLIADDKIVARIDSANKVIYARQSSARNETFQQALAMGNRYTNQARTLLLALSLTEHTFQIAYPKKEKQGNGLAPSAADLMAMAMAR